MNIIIKNGRVIDPQNGIDEIRDIYVKDGFFANLDDLNGSKELSFFDASGMIITPGLVDLHVHFRDPGLTHKEDIETGSKAAARGGYTTVCPMPNTIPVVDNKETVELVRSKETEFVELAVVGALSKGENGQELADYSGMMEAKGGICALSDDGKTLMDYSLMLEASKRAKNYDLFITDHAENHDTNIGGVINEGEVSRKLGLVGIKNSVESDIVERDVKIAKETGCHMHIQHISAKESVELIRKAKCDGLPITAEVTPHHIALTEEAVLIHGSNAKMNPPLRTENDRQAIIEALKDGTIEYIATDHAPHSEEEKAQKIEKAPFGIVGLETAFAVCYTTLVKTGYISLAELVNLMSVNPAKLLNINTSISIGNVANFAIFNIQDKYVINSQEFVSKGKNTPFNGMEIYGKTMLTVNRGNITYKAGAFLM